MKKVLQGLRGIHFKLNPNNHISGRNWKMFSNKEYASELLRKGILSSQPFMAGRYGANEIGILINYLAIQNKANKSYKGYIKGRQPKWWWDKNLIHNMKFNAGFFPNTISNIASFCELMLADTKELDLLGSWLKEEKFLAKSLQGVNRVVLEDLEPFFTPNPWTHALAGKKVLVVHPFTETIEKQYQKKDLIFPEGLLPDFELKTVKAVQSAAGAETDYADWFEALDAMKQQIDATDYEVALIGCGAYGFPLAAHVKRSGKKAIHLAGATQLLFGIKGKRWENYIVWPYMNLFNEYWVRPGENEKPKNAQMVEGACYW